MKRAAIVLWEDCLAQGAKTFGPHQLLLQCMADELGLSSRWDVTDVREVPLKGHGNIKRRLESEAALLAPAGETLVVVYDGDEVARLYGLPRQACRSQVLAAIRSPVLDVDLRVVLLEQNVETLVDAAVKVLGRKPARKSPNRRDAVLNALASSDRSNRETVRKLVPSFERLVSLLVSLSEST